MAIYHLLTIYGLTLTQIRVIPYAEDCYERCSNLENQCVRNYNNAMHSCAMGGGQADSWCVEGAENAFKDCQLEVRICNYTCAFAPSIP